MLKPASISFLIIICAFPVFGQVRIVDISEIGKYHYPVQVIADVEGKVLVGDTNFSHLPGEKYRDDIDVFPGFPVSVPGENERGGTFGNLDNDPELELIYPAGAALYAVNIDGSFVQGWPRTLDFPTDGAAAFGDIDGDGDGEIVVTTHQTSSFAFGSLYAFEQDGSDVNGFPVATDGGGVRSPALADLDNDDALEIIITVRAWPEGFVYVYTGAGDLFPNFPVRMDYVPASAAAVGDINGDGIPEIVTESYYGLHAFTPQGIIVDGFPYLPGLSRVFSYSTPVLADLDGDGTLEIICGDHSIENGSGAVHVVNYLGQPLDGWPKITGNWVFSPPSVGDINGDGLLDIAVGDEILSANPVNKVYAWTGIVADTLDGFPIIDQFGINSQIILADLDGDNNIELMFDDNTSIGNYHGYNHDGTLMEGWPLPVNGSTFYINPVAMDINLDGILDISGAGYDDASGNLNIYLWNAGVEFNNDLAVLPILQYNTRHTGVYGDTFMVGVDEHGGMEAGRQGSVVVFPTPAVDHISIIVEKVTSDRDISVTLYNALGILLTEEEYVNDGREIKLDVAGYPPGIYWIRINNSAEKSVKFIKL